MTLVAVAGVACARKPSIAPPAAARPDLYAVLPSPGGTVGAITVVHGPEREVLAEAYAAVRFMNDGRLQRGRITDKEVRAIFGAALDAQPPAAASFVLYFIFGTDQLTAESNRALGEVKTEVQRRPDPEVIIVGHTDRVGSVAQNDALSLQRAERVRQVLLGLGIPADRVTAVGRGERELLVPTEDQVAEPRNRRVEVTVR